MRVLTAEMSFCKHVVDVACDLVIVYLILV